MKKTVLSNFDIKGVFCADISAGYLATLHVLPIVWVVIVGMAHAGNTIVTSHHQLRGESMTHLLRQPDSINCASCNFIPSKPRAVLR